MNINDIRAKQSDFSQVKVGDVVLISANQKVKWQKITEQNLDYESSNQYSYEFKMPASGIVTLQATSECDTEHSKQIWFFTAEEFKKRFIKALYDAMKAFKIDSKNDRAGFLANVEHETQGFIKPIENTGYTIENWRKFAKNKEIISVANWIAEKGDKAEEEFSKLTPQDKMNIMYSKNKKNLGNIDPNDGWDYRGRGAFHLTGRDNYTRFGRSINKEKEIVADPDLIAYDLYLAAQSAAWYWKVGSQQKMEKEPKATTASERAIDGDFKASRLRVNTGLGLQEVLKLVVQYQRDKGKIPLYPKKK